MRYNDKRRTTINKGDLPASHHGKKPLHISTYFFTTISTVLKSSQQNGIQNFYFGSINEIITNILFCSYSCV